MSNPQCEQGERSAIGCTVGQELRAGGGCCVTLRKYPDSTRVCLPGSSRLAEEVVFDGVADHPDGTQMGDTSPKLVSREFAREWQFNGLPTNRQLTNRVCGSTPSQRAHAGHIL